LDLEGCQMAGHFSRFSSARILVGAALAELTSRVNFLDRGDFSALSGTSFVEVCKVTRVGVRLAAIVLQRLVSYLQIVKTH